MSMVQSEWDQLAHDKLTKVLGRKQGEQVMHRALAALGRASLASAQDLYLFGQHVITEEGFAGTVGALLSTIAVMRGASPPEAPHKAPQGGTEVPQRPGTP